MHKVEVLDYIYFDAMRLELQAYHAYIREFLDEKTCIELESPYSKTVFIDDVPVACGGVMPVWGTRAIAWAFISKYANQHMRILTREVNKYLDEHSKLFGRIECYVDIDFELGHRWAKMLKFELETPLARKYDAFGSDVSVYVRIN